jgi:hypothetical protein
MPEAFKKETQTARRGSVWALVGLLVALFVWGAFQVVTMPLETGEVYPEYSSLRADPLGAKALYESLDALPELSVSRLFKDRSELDSGTALVVLGVGAGSWTEIPQNAVTAYENLLAKGGRLAIAFLPMRMPAKAPSSSPVLKDRWNLRLAYRKREGQAEDVRDNLPRQSALYFEPGPEWRILDLEDGAAVTVERNLGAGSIVLMADSFPLSNEGLREFRDTKMIVNMIGGAQRIAFDENHFGVSDTGSVGTLLRKYGLTGGVAVLIVVAALFMWRSASSFLPMRDRAREEAVAGRDAQEGLAALLRRSVPEKELLDTCYAEWNRTSPPARKAAAVEMAIVAGKNRAGKSQDVAEIYRAATYALKEKK